MEEWKTLKVHQSSRILEIAYLYSEEDKDYTLKVVFKGPKVYEYYHVPGPILLRFIGAESKGKAFEECIKGIYEYKKIESENEQA